VAGALMATEVAPGEAKPTSVRGTVASTSGEALRKAEVMLRPVNAGNRRGVPSVPLSRTTDAAGVFLFEDVAPGDYSVSVQKAGYVRVGQSAARPPVSAPVKVAEGQQVTGINLTLTPQGVVAGRVLDEDGDPVMHASVQILRERWQSGRRTFLPLNADSTDDRGEFRIPGLIAGRYFVQVNANRGTPEPTVRPAGAVGDQAYATLYYPGVSEFSQAAPIQVVAGQEMRGVDFRLRKSVTWRARGRVIDEEGKPALYVTVMAIPLDGGSMGVRSMGVVRNPQGSFETTGLVPGSYTLMVTRAGKDSPRATARTQIQVGNRDVDNLVVQMQRTFEISGILRLPPDVTVPAGLRIQVEALDSGMPYFGEAAAVKPDGTWSVPNLSPGKFRIFVGGAPPEGLYLKSVLAGGQDVTSGAQISGAAAGIELVLAAKAAELTGSALPNTQLVLVPEARDRYWLFRTTTSDDAGAFTFKTLSPGSYSVFPLPADIEDGSWFDPTFLQTLEGKGVAVKLDEAARETVSLAQPR